MAEKFRKKPVVIEAWRVAAHLRETGHSAHTTVRINDSVVVKLVACDGCDFRDWDTNVTVHPVEDEA